MYLYSPVYVKEERSILEKFLGEVARDGLAIYGKEEVEQALEDGKVEKLLILMGW